MNSGGIETLLVIAKEPVPGRVKTRLVPPLSYDDAARLAAAALTDTLDVVSEVPASRHVLAFDGTPDAWLRPGWDVCPQPPGGLDARLVASFASAGAGPALLVGMDTPQLEVSQLCAFDPSQFDACLGLAEDGGYWAIGLREPRMAGAAITNIAMSTAATGDLQLRRLRALGLRVQMLNTLIDVDTIGAAHAVARAAPRSGFAAALRTIREPVG